MGSGVHATSYVSLAYSPRIRSGYVHCSPGGGWPLHIRHITHVWMCRTCGECNFLLPLVQFDVHSCVLLPLVSPTLVPVCLFCVCAPLLPLCHPRSVGCFVGPVLFLFSLWLSHRYFSVSQSYLCPSMSLSCVGEGHVVWLQVLREVWLFELQQQSGVGLRLPGRLKNWRAVPVAFGSLS